MEKRTQKDPDMVVCPQLSNSDQPQVSVVVENGQMLNDVVRMLVPKPRDKHRGD